MLSYTLADNYLRFYFRFIWPHQGLLEQGLYDRLWGRIREQLRAFVGQTAFEDLSREWVLAQARLGRLPFSPDRVGSHWGRGAQVDVAAVSWRERAILLGECKWGTEPMGQAVVRELVEKKPKCSGRCPTMAPAGRSTMPFSRGPVSPRRPKPRPEPTSRCWWTWKHWTGIYRPLYDPL